MPRIRAIPRHVFRTALAALLLFAALLGATVLVAGMDRSREVQALRSRVTETLASLRVALEAELNANVYLANGLAANVIAVPESIDSAMRVVHDLGRHVRNVGVAPDNRLSHIYPLEGNEAAIGLYYPDHPKQWPSARRAIESGTTVLAGPVPLVQGGNGLISRTPVFRDDGSYWGLLSIVLDADSLFETVGLTPQKGSIGTAMRGRDGTGRDGPLILGRADLFAPQADAVTMAVGVPGGTWVMAAAPVGGWAVAGGMAFGFEVIGALLSAGLAVLAFLFLHKREQLKVSERRARALVLHSPMAIILTDAETHTVIDVNQAFADMLGLASPDVIGLNADKLSLMDQAVLDRYRRTLAANGTVEGLTTDLRSNAEPPRTIKVSGHRLMLNGRAHVLTFIADISDEMRAADILRREKEVAETEARVKSRFLAMMSHDFRTPLSAVAGLAQVLHEDEPDPVRRHRLDGILESTAALARMIDDILDMSRLQGGGVRIVEAPFDPVILAERVESVCGPAASQKGLDLVLEIDPDLPALIRGDADRLTQMAMNLVQNAVKFTEAGAVTLALGQTRAEDEARHLLIEVRDTGPGIALTEAEGLFEPFRQGTASAGQRGVGLGLAICRQLAGMMGGRVTVAPNAGGGSVFRLTVPLVVAAPNETDTPAAPERPSLPQSNVGEASSAGAWAGLRVLLAEDTALNREVMAEQLRRAGAEVVAVGDGAPTVVLALVADPTFDVVLLDMDMPTLSGPLAARRLRAHRRGRALVIAALTAYSEQVDRDAGLAAGMDLFFSKPADLTDMARRIKDCRAPVSTGDGSPAAGFDVVAAARGWGDDASPLAALLDRFATTHAGFEGHLTALWHAGRTVELASALHQIVGLASVLHAPRLQSIAEATKKALDETPGPTFAARLTVVEQAVRTHVDVVTAARNRPRPCVEDAVP